MLFLAALKMKMKRKTHRLETQQMDHNPIIVALDGKPVHALFTLVTAAVPTHLHLLARIAYGMRDPGFKHAIASQAGRDQILAEARRLEGVLTSAAARKETR